jgi:hypothetical protein
LTGFMSLVGPIGDRARVSIDLVREYPGPRPSS